jgi:hypothetical protein
MVSKKIQRSFEEANKIISTLFELLNKFIEEEDLKVIYKRKTDFRSAFGFGLLYTRKDRDQLETANIINTIKGYKTHQSSFKKRLDSIKFETFENLINELCQFDKDNFKFIEEIEVIAVDGSTSQVIISHDLMKFDIDKDIDIDLINKKHKLPKQINYNIDEEINYKNDPNDILNFKNNPANVSINVPILDVYNVTRILPLTLSLAKTKNEREAFYEYYKNKKQFLKSFINCILLFDR